MSDYILTIHDELISNLILMNCINVIYNDDYPSKIATVNGKRADISLVLTSDVRYNRFIRDMKRNYTKLEIIDSTDEILKNNFSLSSKEIIVYLILLHHYIISQTDDAVITIRQINKEYRQIKSMNDSLFDSYIRTIEKLSKKQVHFRIKKKYVNNHNLTNYNDTHKLLIVKKCIQFKNDCRFVYNLGSLGKIIRDSKNYSTIVPKGIYSCKYANISYLLMFLYLSRMIYINRNQKRTLPIKRLSLRKICENICKYNRQGYNMNMTYSDIFYSNISKVSEIKFNNQFYETMADDYKVFNERKEIYYNKLVSSNRAKINKCINKNRDLKMIVDNLKSALTILKETHQILDFNLIMPSRIGTIIGETGICNWREINGKNWDMFMIELVFLPDNTQSTKCSIQSMENTVKGIENKGMTRPNIEKEKNKNE